MAEWEEYYRLEPFGQQRGDMQAGLVARTLRLVHGDKQAPDPRAFSIDALIEKDLGPADEEEERAIAERQLSQFRMIAEVSKAELERKEKGEARQPERVLVRKGQEPPGRVRAARKRGRRR